MRAMQRTKQADDEIKATTAAFDEGAPGATVDEHEVAWALRRMAEKEHVGYP